MLTGPAAMMVIVALALCEESARVVAVIVTVFEEGTADGARKSTEPADGPAGATQGFEPVTQIWPTVEFPLAMPLTDHEAAVSGVPVTFAAIEMRWLVTTVCEAGEMLTLTLLVIVTEAPAVPLPDVTPLAAA
jgi:hypothetical protein